MVAIYDVLKASKGIHVDDTFAELWGRKLSNTYTVVTYTGTLPATLQTVEGYLESYKIYGNTARDGTPTPENPVDVVGCGERTGNLLSEKYENRSINGAGAFTIDSKFDLWMGEVVAGQIYTISNMNVVYGFFTTKPMPGTGITYDRSRGMEESGTAVVTVPSGCTWIAIRVFHNADNAMLNLGSTALPYEPYGYKLPILSNSTVTNIYLGKSRTTRKIRKIEVEIERVITLGNGNKGGVTKAFGEKTVEYGLGLCNKAPYGGSSVVGGFYVNQNNAVFVGSPTDTLNDFKSKYDGASLWYVLATEETAVVNEPLMKIGDYADTIDSTQANVQIPTVAGETTISWAGEGLAPSEVELTYRKPKGQ